MWIRQMEVRDMKRKSLITSAMIAASGFGTSRNVSSQRPRSGRRPWKDAVSPGAGRRVTVLPGLVPAERAIKRQSGNFQSAHSGRIHPVLTPPIVLQQARQQLAQADKARARAGVVTARVRVLCGQERFSVAKEWAPGGVTGPSTPGGMGPGRSAGPSGQGQSPNTIQGNNRQA
jgi:hypothetical protein